MYENNDARPKKIKDAFITVMATIGILATGSALVTSAIHALGYSTEEPYTIDPKILKDASQAQAAAIRACELGTAATPYHQAPIKTISFLGQTAVVQSTDYMLDQNCQPYSEWLRDQFYAAQGRQITFTNQTANPLYAAAYQSLLKEAEALMGKADDFMHDRERFESALARMNSLIALTITYQSDEALYVSDHYVASGAETAFLKKGDCDDFAMIKYHILKDLGLPVSRMFVTEVARDKSKDLDHAVLLVNTAPEGQSENWVILDNESEGGIIRQATTSPYKPFYAYNDYGAWTFIKSNQNAGYDVTSNARLLAQNKQKPS